MVCCFFFNFFKILMILKFNNVGVFVCECGYLRKPDNGVRFLEVRGVGDCELPNMGAGKQNQMFYKSSRCRMEITVKCLER